MMTTVQDGQTAFDVILQRYGTLEGGIEALLEDNDLDGELPLGDLTIQGEVLSIRDTVIDQSVVDYHSNTILTSY